MPPKKRGRSNAAKGGGAGGAKPGCGLQPIQEENSPALKQVPSPAPAPPQQEPRDMHGRTKEEAIKFIADEVTERIQALLATGRELAAGIRGDAQMACLRMPKKVREMSVADFFQLSPEEARQSTLTDLSGRLSAYAAPAGGATAAPKPAAEVPATPAFPPTAATTTRTTRRTAARTTASLPQQQAAPATAARATSRATCSNRPAEESTQQQSQQSQQQQEGGSAEPCSPPPSNAAQPATKPSEQSTVAPEGVLRESTNQCGGGAAGVHEQRGGAGGGKGGGTNNGERGLMPPPPPKRGGRQGGKHAESEGPECGTENAAADTAQPAVASTPLPPHQQSHVAGTPVGQRGTQAGLLASASNLNSTVQSLPGGASLMGGFTLMRRTVSRGRTRRAADDENAIMISTSDGRQFMVDAGTGLANVPDRYRKEVSAQLEVIQRLSAAALNIRQ